MIQREAARIDINSSSRMAKLDIFVKKKRFPEKSERNFIYNKKSETSIKSQWMNPWRKKTFKFKQSKTKQGNWTQLIKAFFRVNHNKE